MKEFFVRHALPTARHVTFTDFAAAKAHVESIDYPVVVKRHAEKNAATTHCPGLLGLLALSGQAAQPLKAQ